MKLKAQSVALLLLIGLVGCSSNPKAPALVQGETGSYVVLLNPGEDGPAVAQEYQAKGAVVSAIYQNALQGFAGEFSASLLSELAADPRVKAMEADSVIHLGDLDAQTLTGSWSQDKAPWGLDRIDQESLPLDGKYSYWPAGKGVNVYIVSSGISKTHQDIQGRVFGGKDFVGDGWGTNDCYGEGTASASIIGGKTFGVAKETKLHSVRVLDCRGNVVYSRYVQGLDWILANAQKPAVVHMSVWNNGAGDLALEEAAFKLIASGIPVVITAGNDGGNSCRYSPQDTVTQMIRVGGTNSQDQRFSDSPYGRCLDLFAPGFEVPVAWYEGSSLYAYLSESTLAAAHVSGVAAQYLERKPNASPAEVKEAILKNATAGVVQNAGNGSPNLLLKSWFGLIGTGN